MYVIQCTYTYMYLLNFQGLSSPNLHTLINSVLSYLNTGWPARLHTWRYGRKLTWNLLRKAKCVGKGASWKSAFVYISGSQAVMRSHFMLHVYVRARAPSHRQYNGTSHEGHLPNHLQGLIIISKTIHLFNKDTFLGTRRMHQFNATSDSIEWSDESYTHRMDG